MLFSPAGAWAWAELGKNQIGVLDQHYGGARGCGYENLRMQIIEQVEPGKSDLLSKREIYRQNKLRCLIGIYRH